MYRFPFLFLLLLLLLIQDTNVHTFCNIVFKYHILCYNWTSIRSSLVTPTAEMYFQISYFSEVSEGAFATNQYPKPITEQCI